MCHRNEMSRPRQFVGEVIGWCNARRRKLIEIERAAGRPLPPQRTTGYEEAIVIVSRGGGFPLRKVFYTVPLAAHRPSLSRAPLR
jgi:hypothetical protein